MKYCNLFYAFILLVLSCSNNKRISDKQSITQDKPSISFTFDDGSTADMPGYKLEVWNQTLLDALNKHQVKAVLFATGSRLEGEKGQYVLTSWNKQGHKIGNHTYSHLSYGAEENTARQFEAELLRNDSMIKAYSNYFPYFRFPYLKEGKTRSKTDSIRTILTSHGYKNGHVTIDASDWYISSRLIQRLSKDPHAAISGYRTFYIQHLYDRALYYDSLAYALTNRRIQHVILLHHNLAAALFMDDLIRYFKSRGWDITDAAEAYKDPVYTSTPHYLPAGESLIWALAKQSGKFEPVLRYPAEDGEYERLKMDKLGL